MKKGGVILLMFFSINSIGQNLVPNWSFEDTTSCPIGLAGIIFNTNNWFSANTSSPDLFHSCSNLVGPINNSFGYQLPRTGEAYAVIGSYVPNQSREYISVRLIDSLLKDQTVCFKMFVSLADNFKYGSNKIGVYFSNDSIYSASPNELLYTPQIEFTQMLSDTVNWIELQSEYIAQGGEKFLTIGNFRKNAETDTIVINGPSLFPWIFHYIDDVSLTICPDAFPLDSLHLTLPNVFTPNGDDQNDNFVIEVYGYHNIESMEVQVFNRWGQRIKHQQFKAISPEATENNITQLHIWDGFTNAAAEAPNGTYFYTIKYTTTNDETFTDKKFLTLFR